VIDPSGRTCTLRAAGSRGSPGMVTIEPVLTTTNPAPAASRASRTVIVNPCGTPRLVLSSDSDRWVLAMHTGRSVPTAAVIRARSRAAAAATSMPSAPYTCVATAAIFSR